MTEPSFWNQFFIWPILNILIAFYKGFLFLGLPGAFGLAIIALTILIRLLLYPLTLSQLRSTKKMQELRPHLEVLKNKHGQDKQKLARAQMELYKKHGVNPAAGCLPALLQMPVFIALYQAFWNLLGKQDFSAVVEGINKIVYAPFLRLEASPNFYFLGFNLTQRPSQWQSAGWFLLLIPVVTALLMLVQSLMTMPAEESSPPKEKKKGEGMEEMMAGFQKQMIFLMPLMVGFFALSFPVGLSLYWNTFTLFGIGQQYFTTGWGGLKRYFKFKIAN